MKRFNLFLCLVVVLALAGPVMAQTWHPANQGTVGWDPVAPIEATDVIMYQLYIRQDLVSNGVPAGPEISATQATITFPEGRWFVGAKTIRYPAGETVGIPSESTSWSSNASDCAADGPFGFKSFVAALAPGGLRRVAP